MTNVDYELSVDGVDLGLMMRVILKSQHSHQERQGEQESHRAEGMGRPCTGVPVAGPARVLHVVVWDGDVVWFDVHLGVAYLTKRKGVR